MQAQGSPLVSGAAPGGQALQRVRVLRAFLLGGQRQEVGAVVNVPPGMAQELLYQRRAERVADEPAALPPADTPPATTPAPAAKTTARAPRRAQE